ncbi:MAG: 50S ribosomal protein L21 [Chlamydiae bacterium]|nr:50S ribosomal protein L21 [Chlamydiota bacterium]
MYAIIETGGKQYRVEEGDVLDVELVSANSDGKVEFQQVLFVGKGEELHLGAPYLTNYVVKAELVEEVRGPKVVAFKYKKRKRYRRKVGHRQDYSRVKIVAIAG